MTCRGSPAPVRLPASGPIWPGTRAASASRTFEAFKQGLSEHGYVEGKNIIVETVEIDGNMLDERYMIGRIVGMSARSVAILNFSDTGKWDSEPTILAYKQIKWVTFDSEYVNTFTKYLQ